MAFSAASIPRLSQAAIELAAEILVASRQRETRGQQRQSAMMARMMDDQPGKRFTIAMSDQVLRIKDAQRAADRLNDLVRQYGIPSYFGTTDLALFRVGTVLARWWPSLVMPQVKQQVRRNAAHVIVSAEPKEFARYLSQQKQAGVRVNLSQLGEAVLGDSEADRRLQDNIRQLLAPGVDYISVKLSAITSQISLTGYQQTIDKIKPRLRKIYRAAIEGGKSGSPKFVNLDMEEYRDLDLTITIFKQLLDEPEFEKLEAGMVLQAYLPDSFQALQDLTAWAIKRQARTGAGIKIRLVKGANLAMEQVEASLEDWSQAPYHSKLEVDANFKRMLEFASRPENAAAVRVGVGSHNLFDIALALKLRTERGVEDRIEFEMLEGMANAQSQEVQERSGGMLVYSPTVLDAEFEAAIAYLVRRLDENTAPGSFLGALFSLKEDSVEWRRQVESFQQSCELAASDELFSGSNRQQNRLLETRESLAAEKAFDGDDFHNVANTDFSKAENRTWSDAIIEKWDNKVIEPIPVQIAGEVDVTENLIDAQDPSRPGVVPYQYSVTDCEGVDRALAAAVDAQKSWDRVDPEERKRILKAVAVEFAITRNDAIGSMLVDAGKAIQEADVEVSEAIDFANYYARAWDADGWLDGTRPDPLGVVVVTPPWNFPFAIPAGGILAALAAGNSVIIKPAPETVLVGWQLVQSFWKAGVPKGVLQFVVTDDGETGKSLVSDDRVAAVILTGSIHTARLFQSWKPDLKLFAETSGKNALVITDAADVDLAVKDLVQGAFGHAGQKCSATSLALVQRDVYNSESFRKQLKDAAASLTVGMAWNPSAKVTPVVRPPGEDLQRGLAQLDEGEEWLLEPQMIDENPCLWSPGIRMGVQRGSWYHSTECFGPVLGMICVDDLEEAIEIQNSGEFGLTGGIHSLDPAEIERWREAVEVGNAYINRSTTGAIVRRQPFGGWKNSCVGPGAKAGGPNYVASFCRWSETGLPTLRSQPTAEVRSTLSRLNSLVGDVAAERLTAAAESYAYWFAKEFGVEHDPSQLHGQTNDFRYRPRRAHIVRLKTGCDETVFEQLALTALACQTTGCRLLVSSDSEDDRMKAFVKATRCEFKLESDRRWLESLADLSGASGRFLGSVSARELSVAAHANVSIVTSEPLANGRVELLSYLREQSISATVHRYGNIFE